MPSCRTVKQCITVPFNTFTSHFELWCPFLLANSYCIDHPVSPTTGRITTVDSFTLGDP